MTSNPVSLRADGTAIQLRGAQRAQGVGASRRVVLVCIPLAAASSYFCALTAMPAIYPALLFADVWLFGYAHVAASYMRVLGLELERSQRAFLLGDLLLGSFLLAALMTGAAGVAALSTTYLYWQWFHYTRQAYGLTKLLDGAAGTVSRSGYVALFALPTSAFAHSLTASDSVFMGARVFVPPDALLTAISIGAAGIGVAALLLVLLRIRLSMITYESPLSFLLSALLVFCAAYTLLPLNLAWLVANVWHNVQYLIVVKLWRYSKAGASDVVTPAVLARQFLAFFAICLAGAFVLYGVMHRVLASTPLAGGLFIVAFYMGINFHHYLLDSFIWKRTLRVPRGSVLGWCFGQA